MTLTGKAALDFADAISKREAQKEAELLARKKAEASSRGKEPFDLTKLETMTDTSDQGSLHTPEEKQARWEREYYVGCPDAMTLEEFAKHVYELSLWSGG